MMEAENERNHSTIMATSLTVLQEFRNRLYSLLGNGKAALFDIQPSKNAIPNPRRQSNPLIF
jgi:hypothetical protein